MQSQRCQQLIRGALLLLVSSNAASASSLNNRSESDIVDSNLPRLLRGNENILDGHLNAAIKGEEDESVETAPRLRLCSSTATFSYLYLKIDSSSTLLTSPSRIKIGIRIFNPSASIYF
eukprot:scaffold21160_cov72-Skeletonema_marinoi.AAC.2